MIIVVIVTVIVIVMAIKSNSKSKSDSGSNSDSMRRRRVSSTSSSKQSNASSKASQKPRTHPPQNQGRARRQEATTHGKNDLRKPRSHKNVPEARSPRSLLPRDKQNIKIRLPSRNLSEFHASTDGSPSRILNQSMKPPLSPAYITSYCGEPCMLKAAGMGQFFFPTTTERTAQITICVCPL